LKLFPIRIEGNDVFVDFNAGHLAP